MCHLFGSRDLTRKERGSSIQPDNGQNVHKKPKKRKKRKSDGTVAQPSSRGFQIHLVFLGIEGYSLRYTNTCFPETGMQNNKWGQITRCIACLAHILKLFLMVPKDIFCIPDPTIMVPGISWQLIDPSHQATHDSTRKVRKKIFFTIATTRTGYRRD